MVALLMDPTVTESLLAYQQTHIEQKGKPKHHKDDDPVGNRIG